MATIQFLDQRDLDAELHRMPMPKFLGGIHIPIRPRSKSNWKPTKRNYLHPVLKKFEEDIAACCKTIPRLPKMMTKGIVTIAPRFLKERGSRTDLTNLPKSIVDALVKAGIFSDDKDVSGTVLPAQFGEDAVRIYIFSF